MLVKLKKNYEFARVFRRGKRRPGRYISLHYRRNNLPYNRVGFTTVRHFGNAVARNRMRRLMREAYRSLAPELSSGYDIILMGIRKDDNSDFRKILTDLERALRKEKILIRDEADTNAETLAD